jgi:hypothetical protein
MFFKFSQMSRDIKERFMELKYVVWVWLALSLYAGSQAYLCKQIATVLSVSSLCRYVRDCWLWFCNLVSMSGWMSICVEAQMRSCRQHSKSWQTCKPSWQSCRLTMRDWQKKRVCCWSHCADRLRNWRTAAPKLTHYRNYCCTMTRPNVAQSVSRNWSIFLRY